MSITYHDLNVTVFSKRFPIIYMYTDEVQHDVAPPIFDQERVTLVHEFKKRDFYSDVYLSFNRI